MDTFSLIFIIALFTEVKANVENEEPILYYYGLIMRKHESFIKNEAWIYNRLVGHWWWEGGREVNGGCCLLCLYHSHYRVIHIIFPEKIAFDYDWLETVITSLERKEESERGLPACGARQACAARARRYWRAPALLRLCRCAPRRRCDTRAPPARLLDINNRAHLQFCEPVTDWPECAINESPLTVETLYERMNPDELEELHHQGKQLYPPKIVLTCRCRSPNYWKLSEESDTRLVYQCASLPLCKSGDFCGNVDNDLLALYQSCLCPRGHMCVHSGGVPRVDISELLYRGKGWRAHCQPITDDYNYEDY